VSQKRLGTPGVYLVLRNTAHAHPTLLYYNNITLYLRTSETSWTIILSRRIATFAVDCSNCWCFMSNNHNNHIIIIYLYACVAGKTDFPTNSCAGAGDTRKCFRNAVAVGRLLQLIEVVFDWYSRLSAGHNNIIHSGRVQTTYPASYSIAYAALGNNTIAHTYSIYLPRNYFHYGLIYH